MIYQLLILFDIYSTKFQTHVALKSLDRVTNIPIHFTFVCMEAKIILCLKLPKNMTYIKGLQAFLAQGPQKAGHGSVDQ